MIETLRITSQQAIELYRRCDWQELALRADEITETLHPGRVRTYAIERNINYTNVCRTRCSFCAFSVSPPHGRAYTLTLEQINSKIEPLVELGGTQILLQGGLNPELGFDWYQNMLAGIKKRFPELHIHGFSPPEICFLAERFDMSLPTVLERLRHAGLDSIPGGGAEILVDRVRRLIAPAKCSSEQWLNVMRQAHRLGICTTATMMFGHVETIAERIEHLQRIRQLQDESLALRSSDPAGGMFTAFICWPFQPGRTRLGQFDRYDRSSDRPRRPDELLPADAVEYLKMTALARVYLDNVPNIQASWVTQGPQIAQLSLLAGCNDVGSLMMEENVVAAAGATFQLQLAALVELIRTAGFTPRQRDFFYHPTAAAISDSPPG